MKLAIVSVEVSVTAEVNPSCGFPLHQCGNFDTRRWERRMFIFFRLADNPLPLWDEGRLDRHRSEMANALSSHRRRASGSRGTGGCLLPEWSGMVPAGLKNFFPAVR